MVQCTYSRLARCYPVLFAVFFASMIGCGSEYNLGRVNGKLTCNGTAVANAAIIFTPIAEKDAKAKNAEGTTNANGEFTLTTVSSGDGAIIGKHKVLIAYEDAYKGPSCKTPTEYVVEVKSGTNTVEIELSKIK